jgi:hypothetical protein
MRGTVALSILDRSSQRLIGTVSHVSARARKHRKFMRWAERMTLGVAHKGLKIQQYRLFE